MSQFSTPIKQMYNNPSKQTKTTSQSRDGDWICLNCNNLNFSFRKKCNRCKTQTREQNQANSTYSYYYFAKPYFYMSEGEGQNKNQQHPNLQDCPSIEERKQQNIKKNHKNNVISADKQNKTPKKASRKQELPSVSPLVKKYNARQIQATYESKPRGLFDNESMWSNTSSKGVKQFEEFMIKSLQEDEYEPGSSDETDQLQRIIQRIII